MNNKLEFSEIKCYLIDSHELSRFINQEYNKKGTYEFSYDEEVSNDSQHLFPVKKEKLYEWDERTLEEFVNTGYSNSKLTAILLTDMCNRDVIPEGNYLIKVNW